MQEYNDSAEHELEEGDMLGEDEYPEDAEIEAAEAEAKAEQERADKIEKLTVSVVKKRSDAVQGRKNSGIEEEWQEDEDFYVGIDDANRESLSKPISHTGGASSIRKVSTTRSTVFINITRPYVDSAAARVGDLLLPTDDRNFGIGPSPIPELMEAMGDPTPLQGPMGQQVMMQPNVNDVPAGAMGGMPTNVPGVGDKPQDQMGAMPMPNMGPRPMTVGDLAAKQMSIARKKADAAQKRIDDWLVQCQHNAEMRKVIEDCARLGTGVIKGPFPKKYKYRRAVASGGMMALEMMEEIAPASKRVDPWNLFPDPNCGESIHNGSYLFERDYMTARQLKELVGLPDYDEGKIAQVLEEGPKKKAEGVRGDRTLQDDERFEVWYYYGFIEKDDLDAMGCECEDVLEQIPAVLTLVNDCVIKATLSPIESGEFPFDVMPWQRRQLMPWGIGVARQLNTPQRMLNAATRNMMDNAGLSAGPQIVMKRGVVTPADGKWEITPRKQWWINEDADAVQVQHAFMAIQIPAMQVELNNIIQFALAMAEQTTGLPMLLQGQSGQVGPAGETVGGMTILMNNASVVLRRMARTFDDYITEPHIRRYYDWLMVYGEDENEKGDFVIDARGSSALVERDLQNQAVMQLGQMVLNPAFGISPDRWMREALKAQRLDPEKFLLTPEEKQALQQQAAQQQQAPAPAVQAAQIKAEADLKKAEISANLTEKRISVDRDRDTVYVQAQGNRDQIQAQAKMAELQLKRELALLEYANTNRLAIQDVKASLAETAMKLQVQKELSAMGKPKQVIKPPSEPAGKAPSGEAYQR